MKRGDVNKGQLPFAKPSQINSRGLTRNEQYETLKEIFVSIYNRYLVEHENIMVSADYTMCMQSRHMIPTKEIALSHITTKGANADLIFNLNNLQLLTWGVHALQEERKLPQDLRSVEFKAWLKDKKLDVVIKIGG